MRTLDSVAATFVARALVLLTVLVLIAPAATAEEPAKPTTTPTWAETQKLAREGNLPRAIVAARAMLDTDPSNAAAARLLQDLLRTAGKKDDVATEAMPLALRRGLSARAVQDPQKRARQLASVLKLEGAAVEFRLDHARALTAMGKRGPAESEVQRYLKAKPDDPAGLTELGLVLLARKKHKAAAEALAAALAPDPGAAEPAIAMAELHWRKERPAEARAVLQKALGVYPRNPDLLAGLADDQVRAGELEPALRTLASLLELPVEKSAVHARLAEVHRMRKALPDAERCAKAALAIDANCVRALRVIGFVQQKREEVDAALATYEKAAKLAPRWAEIHADVGFVHMLRGKTIMAERALRKALELDEDLLFARRTLGIVMFQRGKQRDAKKELGIVLKQDDEDIRANRYMGYILLDEGKSKAALKHFRKVAELAPKDADSVRMMGEAYMRAGKLEDAINAFQEAIGRDAKYGWAYFDMGRALEKQERFEDAAAAYRKATELDKKLPHPHLYLAELLDEVLDDPEGALKHYQSYLDLGGHGEGGWIKKRVEQLEREIEEDKKK
ncbi:MAG: tetratricopeptide repeat protein [Planctomycetota bacterium]|nr:tetratricopeptide repeat protein [Planctomycetota bacterium]